MFQSFLGQLYERYMGRKAGVTPGEFHPTDCFMVKATYRRQFTMPRWRPYGPPQILSWEWFEASAEAAMAGFPNEQLKITS